MDQNKFSVSTAEKNRLNMSILKNTKKHMENSGDCSYLLLLLLITSNQR